MALKAQTGDRDMFDAARQQEKRDRRLTKQRESQYQASAPKPDVFDFINKRLGGKKGIHTMNMLMTCFIQLQPKFLI